MKRNNLQGQVVALETEKLHLENEIERLNGLINIMELSLNKKSEVMKEVREYIEIKYLSEFDDFEKPFILTDKNDWNKVLEILDKENI